MKGIFKFFLKFIFEIMLQTCIYPRTNGLIRQSYKNQIKKVPQSKRDQDAIQQRIIRNGYTYQFVSNYMDKYFDTHVTSSILLNLANIIIAKNGIKLDRLAKRNRSALICWYAENWNIIHPILKDLSFINNLVDNNENCEKFDQKINIPIHNQEQSNFDPSNISLLLNYH